MSTLTQEPATEGQVKQLSRVAADAAEKAVKDYGNLSKESAQQLHGNPEFATRVREAMILILTEMSNPDQFADEETDSSYGYLSGYAPKLLEEQATQLKKLFPNELGQATFDLAVGQGPLPENAEGQFLIPRWQLFGKTYPEAVQVVLDKIKEVRGSLYNYRDGQIDEAHLRQHAKKEEFFCGLSEEQSGHNLLVVAAQFGLRHRGKSVRRARVVMWGGECGLGAFEIGMMLLTHPERLMNYDDLWIDCAGDEFSPDGDGDFSVSPYFGFVGVQVGFGARVVDGAHDYYGSASVFPPVVSPQ
ncbi:MAG: hypothetical protein WCV68_00005 [Candidatus Paceibacterota bacterium]|jgi:hypothetical protein